jgi:hypothetical protein
MSRLMVVSNKLNADTWVTLNGVDLVPLPATTSITLDAGSDGMKFPVGSAFGVYCMSATPTSGWIGIAPL